MLLKRVNLFKVCKLCQRSALREELWLD